jgi:hypothetical protein
VHLLQRRQPEMVRLHNQPNLAGATTEVGNGYRDTRRVSAPSSVYLFIYYLHRYHRYCYYNFLPVSQVLPKVLICICTLQDADQPMHSISQYNTA